jgi:hypothetical protein
VSHHARRLIVTAAVVFAAGASTLEAQSRRVNVAALDGPKQVLAPDSVREVAAGAKEVTIRPDEFVIARWAQTDARTAPVVAQATHAWAVGYGFIGMTRDGREVRFRPIIETTGGLHAGQNADGFQGSVFVGLVDLRDPTAAYELPRPVALLVTGQADSVSPRQLQIGHTNLPFTEVTVGARDPMDELELQLIASGTTERATVRLPVVRPRLELAAARPAIQGFGMESVEITLRAIGLQAPEGRVVTLSSERGSLDPARVALDAQGTGTTRLRSVSIGDAVVSASSPPLTPASAAVRFAWPIAVLVAAIAGGMIGAYLGRVQRSRIRTRRTLRSVAFVGLLTGIVVVVLYAVGVNVLPVQPTATAGEALAFALAAVGGYLGLRIPAAA